MSRPRLVGALLLKNEAGLDRYLRPVLARCQELCDTIVALDDGSTDDTVEVCESFGAIVKQRDSGALPAWGNEASARAELWDLASEQCPDRNSWVLFCDADMILRGDPRPLLMTRELNSWAMPLYDLWSDTHYREDQWWQGHHHARIWIVAPKRTSADWQPLWDRDGLHVGHLPSNWPAIAGICPPDIYWTHHAYQKPLHRQVKAEQYLNRAHLLSPHERAHAESILSDPTATA